MEYNILVFKIIRPLFKHLTGKILEDPELYPDPGDGPDKIDQKVRRRRVCEKLAMVPGKLDHATIAAYQVRQVYNVEGTIRIIPHL